MSGQCAGGPGTWALYTLAPPLRIGGGRLEPSIQYFARREDALAARAAWKQRHANNPEALASVAPWQPPSGAKKGIDQTAPKAKLRARRR